MKQLNELAKEINQNAKDKGFYDIEPSTGERIALMHSELSEALEADRKGKYANNEGRTPVKVVLQHKEDKIFQEEFRLHIKDTLEDEYADTIIRILDHAAHKGMDIESHIEAKMRYNSMRPKMHGGKKY